MRGVVRILVVVCLLLKDLIICESLVSSQHCVLVLDIRDVALLKNNTMVHFCFRRQIVISGGGNILSRVLLLIFLLHCILFGCLLRIIRGYWFLHNTNCEVILNVVLRNRQGMRNGALLRIIPVSLVLVRGGL